MTMDEIRFRRLETAKLLAMSGKYEQALEMLQKIIAKYRDDVEALRLMGNVIELCVYSGCDHAAYRIEDAKSCYDRIIFLDKNNIYAKIDIADLMFESGKKNEAKRLYEEVLKLSNEMDAEDVNHVLARIEDCRQGRKA